MGTSALQNVSLSLSSLSLLSPLSLSLSHTHTHTHTHTHSYTRTRARALSRALICVYLGDSVVSEALVINCIRLGEHGVGSPLGADTFPSSPGRQVQSGGHAVAQLVDGLLYKPEGRGFYSRWCRWNFSLT